MIRYVLALWIAMSSVAIAQQIKRLPGPHHPHRTGCGSEGCRMCCGIHMQSYHSVPYSHLSKIGSRQWRTYHNNLHNQPDPPPKSESLVRDLLFAPTPPEGVDAMLKLARVTSKDVVYDLGSGDGRIVIAAAKDYGCTSVGLEVNPKLVTLAKQRVQEAKLDATVQIIHADVLETDFSQASVVTLYLFPELLAKLAPRLRQLKPGTRIVSYAHSIPGMKADKTVVVKGDDGTECNVYLIVIPWSKLTRESPLG
jgi:SAM-dependent methyltransferase